MESSLSSKEEEEVARGSEERDNVDNEVERGGEAQRHLHYNRLSLISSSGSSIARLRSSTAFKSFFLGPICIPNTSPKSVSLSNIKASRSIRSRINLGAQSWSPMAARNIVREVYSALSSSEESESSPSSPQTSGTLRGWANEPAEPMLSPSS